MLTKFYLIFIILFMVMITFQIIHYLQFQDEVTRWVNKGPRFTAFDGQVLCERVQKLEKNPYPCRYAPTIPAPPP